ncbi:MAG TPA: DUF6790 family protein [Candidatus Saccharimonadales bacterium]|nr:DUF6790 family protein [Candidatus Saccharimonadales bacterium]
MSDKIFGLILPGVFVLAWIMALSGSDAPGAIANETIAEGYIRWMLYFAGFVFASSFVMHSFFAKRTASSIGWKTNGFQYEISFVSLGLGLACFYATYHGLQAWIAVSIPIITFLFLAGLNHLREIFAKKNFAPNNTFILVWDFGMPVSLAVLLLTLI